MFSSSEKVEFNLSNVRKCNKTLFVLPCWLHRLPTFSCEDVNGMSSEYKNKNHDCIIMYSSRFKHLGGDIIKKTLDSLKEVRHLYNVAISMVG